MLYQWELTAERAIILKTLISQSE